MGGSLYMDNNTNGCGWFAQDWRDLVENYQAELERAERELATAVRLARTSGAGWDEIARTLRLPVEETRCRFDHPVSGRTY